MQFIDFRDQCVITRNNGQKDDWDNAVNPTQIYSGPCLYEEGGTSYTRVFTTRNPTVFLPDVYDDMVMMGDRVVVSTEFGREIKAVVKIVRDINMPWRTNVRVTRIELKQAQGD